MKIITQEKEPELTILETKDHDYQIWQFRNMDAKPEIIYVEREKLQDLINYLKKELEKK